MFTWKRCVGQCFRYAIFQCICSRSHLVFPQESYNIGSFRFAGRTILLGKDCLQLCSDLLASSPGNTGQNISHEMDHAALVSSLRIDFLNRLYQPKAMVCKRRNEKAMEKYVSYKYVVAAKGVI